MPAALPPAVPDLLGEAAAARCAEERRDRDQVEALRLGEQPVRAEQDVGGGAQAVARVRAEGRGAIRRCGVGDAPGAAPEGLQRPGAEQEVRAAGRSEEEPGARLDEEARGGAA